MSFVSSPLSLSVLASTVMLISACQGQHDDTQSPRPSADSSLVTEGGPPDVPTLIVPIDEPEAVMEAGVGGQLGINDRNCFTLDGDVFVAPFGSTVAGELHAHITGFGIVQVGERVEGGGGTIEAANLPDIFEPTIDKCVDNPSSPVRILQYLADSTPP